MPAEDRLRWLDSLERAYIRLVDVLELPAPRPDDGRGGTDALDLYLTDEDRALHVQADGPLPVFWDQSAAFCSVGALHAEDERERLSSLCVAEAIALGLDAAESPALRRAYATYLWWLMGSPTARDWAAIDDRQTQPERAINASDSGALAAEGAALFFEYLDARASGAPAGAFATSLLAAGIAKTAPSARAWDNEPDAFDVLRHTLDERPLRMASLASDFATSRAFLGSRDDGTYWPWLMWAGDFGRIRYDWRLDFSTLPRRVAAQRPIDPTGSVYVWVDLQGAPAGTTLGVQGQWEAPVAFVWELVRVSKEGAQLSRVDVPFQTRATSFEQTVTQLDGAAALLIVGTNMGGVDLEHPFDPDLSPYEPSGCTIYVARL